MKEVSICKCDCASIYENKIFEAIKATVLKFLRNASYLIIFLSLSIIMLNIHTVILYLNANELNKKLVYTLMGNLKRLPKNKKGVNREYEK